LREYKIDVLCNLHQRKQSMSPRDVPPGETGETHDRYPQNRALGTIEQVNQAIYDMRVHRELLRDIIERNLTGPLQVPVVGLAPPPLQRQGAAIIIPNQDQESVLESMGWE
jgi:hypothetical protein